MKAIVYDKPGSFTLEEVPTPQPGPLEVLLRVIVAGVCGTDLHLHDGEFGPTYPLTPGHEIVGEVVEIGESVTQLKVGDQVTFDNTASCGHCDECRRARPAFCRFILAQGVNAPGGFAEYVTADADRCFVVNDLDPEVAVFAEPAACVVHGLDVLALKPGASVLLFGAGPTGLLLAQLLAKSGAGELTIAAPTAAKLALASTRGADHILQIARGGEFTAELLEQTGGVGFDVVIDATGALGVLENAISLTRTGGTVFIYGMTSEEAMLPISPYEVFRRELIIKGSFAQQFAFDRALSALRTGRINTTDMVTHRFTLDQYGEALAAVADSSCIKAVIRPGGIS
jgi:D-arabinitol dehydrogenase (NADP+)